jgi:two-component system response regulator
MIDERVDILLVEDNPSDLALAMRVFKPKELAGRLHVVRDGAEALEFVFSTDRYTMRRKDQWPAVILLDLKLPLVSGIEVLRKIKSDDSTRAIPVVMLTASHQERDMLQCYELGANSYIVKPIDFDQFAEAMEQVVRYWLFINQSPQRG